VGVGGAGDGMQPTCWLPRSLILIAIVSLIIIAQRQE
jgi:hypothetical protein